MNKHEVRARNRFTVLLLMIVGGLSALFVYFEFPYAHFFAVVMLFAPTLNALIVLKQYYQLSDEERETTYWGHNCHPCWLCGFCMMFLVPAIWTVHPYLVGVLGLLFWVWYIKIRNDA